MCRYCMFSVGKIMLRQQTTIIRTHLDRKMSEKTHSKDRTVLKNVKKTPIETIEVHRQSNAHSRK